MSDRVQRQLWRDVAVAAVRSGKEWSPQIPETARLAVEAYDRAFPPVGSKEIPDPPKV